MQGRTVSGTTRADLPCRWQLYKCDCGIRGCCIRTTPAMQYSKRYGKSVCVTDSRQPVTSAESQRRIDVSSAAIIICLWCSEAKSWVSASQCGCLEGHLTLLCTGSNSRSNVNDSMLREHIGTHCTFPFLYNSIYRLLCKLLASLLMTVMQQQARPCNSRSGDNHAKTKI